MNINDKNRVLSISIDDLSYEDILYKIQKCISKKNDFCHILSLNPENLVIAHENNKFKDVVTKAQIRIVDGVGVVVAGRILGFTIQNRITGVDLMSKLLSWASSNSLSVLLIGGEEKIAESIANCQNQKNLSSKIIGLRGIKNIKEPKRQEEEAIFSIVRDLRPCLVFVSFGSPYQEIWIEEHKEQLRGCVCIGVGGAFDFISSNVLRAPKIFRKLGMEWFFRLCIQPWRIKRQFRLIKFMYLVIKEKLNI